MKLSWKNCLRIAVTVFILYLCMFYWESVSKFLGMLLQAALPIFMGFAIAYVLNILMSFYERHYFKKHASKTAVPKSRRVVCMIGAIVTLIAIVAAVIGLVVPELISCVKILASDISPAIERALANDWVKEVLPEDIQETLASVDWKALVSKVVDTFGKGIGNAAGAVVNVVSAVVSSVVTFFVSVIFAIYALLGKDKLKCQGKKLLSSYLPGNWEERILYGFTVFDDSFHRFIVGQCTEAVILGALCIIGMLIFRFPYATMIGTLVGFTALIPIAGAYIGAIVGAVMIFTVKPFKALLFIVFIIVLQQLEGNLIYPRVVGKSIGLPAMWVLAAITVGGSLMGIPGMLIGVPTASALYRLIREDVEKREAKECGGQAKAPDELQTEAFNMPDPTVPVMAMSDAAMSDMTKSDMEGKKETPETVCRQAQTANRRKNKQK